MEMDGCMDIYLSTADSSTTEDWTVEHYYNSYMLPQANILKTSQMFLLFSCNKGLTKQCTVN